MIFLLFCQYSGFRRIRFLFTLRNRAISLPGDPHSLISQVTFGRGSTIIAGSRVILSDEKMKPEDLVCASASEQPGVILEEGNFPVELNLPKREHSVISWWRKINAFQRSLEISKDNKHYVFYDGPPFATGLPHYGHILAGTVKDLIGRYATMNGHYVERRFGWDTHGLPIEHMIDKKLGISSKKDIYEYGIDNYNEECRKVVLSCANDWKSIVERVGRWVDFDNCYKTMDKEFMESIWWCFKHLYDMGAVYRSYRVMPYSTAVHSTLSNFEVSLNYTDVSDPSIIVSFPLIDEDGASLLAWTTTPWTLPTNLALCLHPDEIYVKIMDKVTGRKYIIMECRLQILCNSSIGEYDVIDKFPGKELEGLKYEPIFDFFYEKYKNSAYKVLCSAEAVTTDTGTGIVQMSPAHGEIDFKTCEEHGVFSHNENISRHFDESGRFTELVKPYEGTYFKDADKLIIKSLKASRRLIKHSTEVHSYPFCWRSNTPLMYIAMPCWFVKVADISHQLVDNLMATNWVPDYVGSKRFHNWIVNAKDWNISRERYWGTPIPLWVSDDGEEIVAIGSIEELKSLSGCGEITDIHPHRIQHIKIPSTKGKGYLTRVPYVFDCWFESGSMPYSQFHYPFKNPEMHTSQFPADFISEGMDQTRGWFYTLLVLASHISGVAPYKNVVVVGHILAEDGKKMSKSKGNYPDPMKIIEKYGADVLRVYLINSPVLCGENLRFSEKGLRETLSRVFTPWYNSVRFFSNQVDLLRKVYNINFEYNPNIDVTKSNYMDRWILSSIQSLVKYTKIEIDAYRLYNAIPHFEECINNIANWYIRLNRRRLKCESGVEEACYSLNALFEVLLTLCMVMAPLSPFFSEMMYANLSQYCKKYLQSLNLKDHRSVHFLNFPKIKQEYVNPDAERATSCLKDVINLGRLVREKYSIMFKLPCPKMTVLVNNDTSKKDIESLSQYIIDEMNVKKLIVSSDTTGYDIDMRLEPNYKVLGGLYKSKMTEIKSALNSVTRDRIYEFFETGKLELLDRVFTEEEVVVIRSINVQNPDIKVQYTKNTIIMLDTSSSPKLTAEWHMRDIINQVQKLRKKSSLVPTDYVLYRYEIINGDEGLLANVINTHGNYLKSVLRGELVKFSGERDAKEEIIASENHSIADVEYKMYLLKP